MIDQPMQYWDVAGFAKATWSWSTSIIVVDELSGKFLVSWRPMMVSFFI